MTGFQKLLCLSLERSPAADMVKGAVAAWVECLTANREWKQDRDAPRIRQAFLTLAQTRRQWPAPIDFTEALPRVPPLRALPGKPADPAKVAKIIEGLTKELRA